MILRQPCKYFLKGTCTRSLCEYWHPPECQFYKTESGCKAGDKCLFRTTRLTSNQIKSTKKSEHSHKRRESDDKNAVAIVKIVPKLGCVSQDSDALVSQRGKQPGKTRCKKSCEQFDEYGSLSQRYVKQVSEKRKDHRLEKYKSNILISEVPSQ